MSLKGAGPVVLVGAGKMGGALLSGWLAGGLEPSEIFVLDPQPPPEAVALLDEHGIALNPAPEGLADPSVVVLAVKPQIMDKVLDGLIALVRPGTLFLSVAAGRTVASIAARLGEGTPVVRTIPNTPAAIARGMTVAFAGANVSAEQRKLASRLLEAVGDVGWVEEEALIDAATAVSGSGPAYVFYLAECLAEAGVRCGLPPELAARAARVTVEGAGELMHRSDLTPAELRENVTSPGGTTAAALSVLGGEDGLAELMARAVAAAKKRASELSE
ncbi:MAG TPA: pyrroline-5-carboxylate reductase [Hyphomicrobiales bacterium]|nr:pyrroline-5-carboxylate reductase [Hyphomicrobiales bacterium]